MVNMKIIAVMSLTINDINNLEKKKLKKKLNNINTLTPKIKIPQKNVCRSLYRGNIFMFFTDFT
jgi:hypothetical protein